MSKEERIRKIHLLEARRKGLEKAIRTCSVRAKRTELQFLLLTVAGELNALYAE